MQSELLKALLRVIPFLAVIAVISLRVKKKAFSKEALYLQRPQSITSFTICWLGFLLYAVLVEILLYKAGLLEVDAWRTQAVIPSAIKITGAVILAPVAEELIFRGILLLFLEKWKVNVHAAILMQAVLFVLLHSFTYQHTFTSYLGIVQGLIDASLFAYAKYYTRSLYTPMAMHATGNLIATLERFIL